jgi:hypothetical protein
MLEDVLPKSTDERTDSKMIRLAKILESKRTRSYQEGMELFINIGLKKMGLKLRSTKKIIIQLVSHRRGKQTC